MFQGPGFGKTTALAVATLAMQGSLGRILCSAPSNVAVDNFAARIDSITSTVTARYNKDMQEDAPDRMRHKLVVRAYKTFEEMDAFLILLENPSAGNTALFKRGSAGTTTWQLNLSIAFWLLVVLRSSTVRPLHLDDHKVLHEMRERIDERNDLDRLRAVASGEMAWDDYKGGSQVQRDKLTTLMKEILAAADMLCTTPEMTENCPPYHAWKKTAKGVAVDEAANMNRADLVCVWGNVLLPCFLGGDPKQLPPTVMTSEEKDMLGNFLHQLPRDGKISALGFFQASGVSVYRLRTQLRMAKGLFDAVASQVYPDVPFKYAESCAVQLPQFETGRVLEAYILKKYPDVKPAPASKLSPVFIHCEGSKVFVNEVTGSKSSPDQVKIALQLALDLVNTTQINSSSLVMLSPYSANVHTINNMLKGPGYAALNDMPPASTVDGFQGKEADIVIVVMGTASLKPGPGITSDEQRLNVMLTRQRCGLVIVGDLNVTGTLVEDSNGKIKDKGKGKGKGKAKGKGKVKPFDRFLTFGPNGQISWTKATILQNLHIILWKAGRFAHLYKGKSVTSEVGPSGSS